MFKRFGIFSIVIAVLLNIGISTVFAQNTENELIIADAGKDMFVKKGSEIVFDASGSNIPAGIEPIYRWDMGDGELRFGMRNIYTYKDIGVYRVKLVVEGKNTDLKSVDEAIIHIFDKKLLVLSSKYSSTQSDISRVENAAIANNMAVDSIFIDTDYPSQVSLKRSFMDQIIANKGTVDNANVIVLIGQDSMEAFLEFSNKFTDNWNDKKIVLLTTGTRNITAGLELAKMFQNTLEINTMRVQALSSFSPNILNFDSDDFSGHSLYLDKGRDSLGLVDFLFRFNVSLLERGFSLDIIYFLYIMILISLFTLSLRKIFGLAVVGVHILGLTVFSFIILGLLPSLILFIGFFLVSYIVHKVYETDRETIFSGSFIDMLMVVFYIVIGLSIIKLFIPSLIFSFTNFMAVVVMAISSRRLARYTLGMSITRIFIHLLQDVLFLVFNYLLLTSAVVRLYVLTYPEFYIVLVFLSAILLERYRGLRMSEIFRFRNLLRGQNFSSEVKE